MQSDEKLENDDYVAEIDEVPLGEIPELDHGELRNDTLEFERVRVRVPRDRRRRRSLLILVALIIAGAGVVWTFGDQWLNPDPGQIPLVKSPTEPFKIKPDNPGGMKIPNMKMEVYDRVPNNPSVSRVEKLLPPPEQPMPAPRPKAGDVESFSETSRVKKRAKTQDLLKDLRSVPQESQKSAVQQKSQTSSRELQAADTNLKVTKTKIGDSQLKPMSTAKSGQDRSPKLTVDNTVTVKSPKNVEPKLVPDTYGIQLVSVRKMEAAEREWKRLKSRHTVILEGLDPKITKADLGAKGVYYRLRAGPISDRASAKDICSRLSKVKVGCLVVRPGG